MKYLWTKWILDRETKYLNNQEVKKREEDGRQLIRELQKAFHEWQAAQKNFEEITEKEQVDYAIYAMEAAEKRYENLIRAAKTSNITLRKKNLTFF